MAPRSDDDDKRPKLDRQMKKELKERKEEIALFDRFKSIATSKLEAMTRQSEESGVKYQMGDHEKQVLRSMNGMGIKEGIAAGVVSFLVLRKGPIYVARWVYKRRLAQRQAAGQGPPPQRGGMKPPPGDGSYQLSNPNGALLGSANPFQEAKNPYFPRSRNYFIRGIWLAFDSMLSLMMAASISMAYTDTDKIRQQLLELPLVPGRSLSADALCDDLVQELQRVQKENSPAYQRLTRQNRHGEEKSPASSYLEGITAFSDNCQRRRFVERNLREDQGLADGEPVEIRDPIPSDGPRLIANDDGREQIKDTQESDSFFDNDFQDTNWVDDFVADQEDEKESESRKRK